MELERDDLTAKQKDYAVFLPALSGFYGTFIGKQRVNQDYVDPARIPAPLKNMETMNWLNSKEALFPYKWSLYSGGHANLDLTKPDASEDMVRNREPGTFMLGDSGGFQIAKGLWEGDWRDPTGAGVTATLADCNKRKTETREVKDKKGKTKTITVDLVKEQQDKLNAAQTKRDSVLKWLDGIADYGMILDIPTWVIHDPVASKAVGITTYQDAVDATKYNNDYFMKHRKGVENGGAKFLNVLQGSNHGEADAWYDIMKSYCDPKQYPDTHFNGWAMGGQNMCDVHLILRRLIAMKYDGMLQEGVHDWMHFLGTSKLEWALLLTDIQRAVRKYVNPSFTISFDCASPFLATANGQMYHHVDLPNQSKWCYRMSPSADNKKYATDTRPFGQATVADGYFPHFDESPISKALQMKDICIYKDGVRKTSAELNGEEFDVTNLNHYSSPPDLNKNGKVGKTSWDSFSYALMMGHNVWTHLHAVQEANRRYDAGEYPAMMRFEGGSYEMFKDIVEAIFAAPTREDSEYLINVHYESYWEQIIGTRGFKGKKAVSARPQFNNFFDVVEPEPDTEEHHVDDSGLDETNLDALESGV
jgi:hypothetical protein